MRLNPTFPFSFFLLLSNASKLWNMSKVKHRKRENITVGEMNYSPACEFWRLVYMSSVHNFINLYNSRDRKLIFNEDWYRLNEFVWFVVGKPQTFVHCYFSFLCIKKNRNFRLEWYKRFSQHELYFGCSVTIWCILI